MNLWRYGDSGHSADERHDLDAYAADLKAVLRALPNRAFVIAAGLGAALALAAIGEAGPHLISGLALVDADISSDDPAKLSAAAARVTAPVTLIRGALGATILQDDLLRLQLLMPGAEVAKIADGGMDAAADREDAFNSVLLDVLKRRAPRRPLTFLGGSEPRLVRDALGCLGTGATIVTTVDAAGAPVGLTANSFTSVSLDPPLILFSLAKTSASLAVLVEAERFAVNVLHIGQQPMAGLFAQRDVARFESVDWSIQTEGGSPILVGSLVSFECRTHAVHEGGDHLIFVGEVSHAWFEPHRDPLLYFRGKFRRLHFF